MPIVKNPNPKQNWQPGQIAFLVDPKDKNAGIISVKITNINLTSHSRPSVTAKTACYDAPEIVYNTELLFENIDTVYDARDAMKQEAADKYKDKMQTVGDLIRFMMSNNFTKNDWISITKQQAVSQRARELLPNQEFPW